MTAISKSIVLFAITLAFVSADATTDRTFLRATITGEDEANYYADWMGHFKPVISDMTLLDFALPATHDTLTYDLSKVISRGAWDDHPIISYIIHTLHMFAPGTWIRDEAWTQSLTVTEQLDNGVRFLDFRMMMDGKDWYSLHFVRTNTKTLDFLRQIRGWMDAHPNEVVIIYTSRHGGVCEKGEEAFPGVSSSDKHKLWADMKDIFNGIIFDQRVSQLNETTLGTLVERNHRAILAIGTHDEFAENDPLAVNACGFRSGNGDTPPDPEGDGTSFYSTWAKKWKAELAEADDWMDESKADNKFAIRFYDGAPPKDVQMLDAFKLRYLPFFRKKKHMASCVQYYNVTGMDNWCPSGLLDNSQLNNYYLQEVIDEAYNKGIRLPSIAVNALDHGGVLRTGTQPLLGKDRTKAKGHETTSYALVPTLLASNVRYACKQHPRPECEGLMQKLDELRAQGPLSMWCDPAHGRLESVSQESCSPQTVI